MMTLKHSANAVDEKDKRYMRMALEEAMLAKEAGDVPVGAVLVENATGRILAVGRNTREADETAVGHAEINAIMSACKARGHWRLTDSTLYVTLEPCPMCAGAILHARIGRVVCGAMDPVAGAMGSVWALHRYPQNSPYAHLTVVDTGCLASDCQCLLQTFFRERRGEEQED